MIIMILTSALTPLEKLPEDIVSAILSHLEIHDLAAFQQASWTTYHQASSDALWHQLLPTFHLPISVPLEEALSLPTVTLRKVLNRASRLEKKLRTSRPYIQETANVQSSDIIDPSRPRACWSSQRDFMLVFSHDNDSVYYLSITRLAEGDSDAQPRNELRIHLPEIPHSGVPTGIVTTRYQDYEVVVLDQTYPGPQPEIVAHKLLVLSIALQRMDASSMSKLMGEINTSVRGVDRFQCCGDITGLIYTHPDGPRLLLVNHCTGNKIIYSMEESGIFYLWQKHFILIRFTKNDVTLSVYPLPDQIKRRPSSLSHHQSSLPFSLDIDDTTPANMDLPPALEVLRLPEIPQPSLVNSYFIAERSSHSNTALSIGADIDVNPQTSGNDNARILKHCIYTVSLPLYVVAPNSPRATMELADWTSPTETQLARSRLMLINAGASNPPRHMNGPTRGITSFMTGRTFWTACEYQFQPGVPTIVRVYTAPGGSVTPSGRAVRGGHHHYHYLTALDGSLKDDDDNGSRVLCELRLPGYVDVYDLSVWYDEHLGRLCLLYQEHESSSEGDDQSWTLRARVWDIDTEYDS